MERGRVEKVEGEGMNVCVADGKIKIGVCRIPQRKKLCLCVEEENTIHVYGTFINQASATAFMDYLIKFVDAKEGGGSNE